MCSRFALILCLLLVTVSAQAKTALDVEVGWEGVMRMGRWTPVQVTLSDPDGANALVEISAAHDQIFSMRVREPVGAITAQPKTFIFYVPVNGYIGLGMGSVLSVVVRDAGTGKVLAHTREEDSRAFNPVQQVDAQGQLIGTSGRRSSLSGLRNALGSRLAVGHLAIEKLPVTPVGYDAIELLLLDEADLNSLSDDQQTALLRWVRAGGTLLFWPGTDPSPKSGPLIDALPCTVGGATIAQLSPDVLKAALLTPRFAKVPARLLEPRSNVQLLPLLNGSVAAYRSEIGLGRIIVSPINLDDVTPADPIAAQALWKPVLGGALDLKMLLQSSTTAGYNGYGQAETQQSLSESGVADLLGDVPGAGQFGFSYVAIALIGLMVIVGPVDWIVLRAIKRQPWTWVTTTGWIGLVTVGALYTGHAFKSGDLHYRTYTLIDQAGGGAVARTEFVGLYSPRTTTYTLETGPDGWWEPMAASQYLYSQRTGSELPYAQTYHGNTPLPMQANIWSLRFQKGHEYIDGPKLIDAELTLKKGTTPPRVVGTIKNLTDRPLRNIRVVVHEDATFVLIQLTVPANAAIPIDEALSLSQKPDPKRNIYMYPPYAQESATEQTPTTAAQNLVASRAEQFKRRMEGGGFALVIAEQDAPAPTTTLKNAESPVERHVRVIRALVPIRTE
jgi:hypothetical protein